MRLQDLVWDSIVRYPSLYRDGNLENSRLRVLSHLFLTIGNGYEWQDGILTLDERYEEDDELLLHHVGGKVTREPPSNFFSIKLFYIECVEGISKVMVQFDAEKRYYYVSHGYLYYEATAEEAGAIHLEHKATDSEKKLMRLIAEHGAEPFNLALTAEACYPHTPYPISEYSAIREMTLGETNGVIKPSRPIENVPTDWVQGAIDIARWSHAYFHDPEQYKNDSYYPGKHPMTHDLPPKKAAQNWEKYRAEQIKYLEEFLNKFT